ncbi:AZOBR_p60025 family cell surface glycopolymer formation protein [Leptospira ilyithenensis]|uniref:Glycosyltransferase RgtA/B/C/D-like domain-containing protein n=1 Tax=Leptospira ilyithenensis TaxID=2484901 RepID=A0A4R9LSV1_9LEPT|nr:hypothetical protein [Leptospira ilyithenensis]TGN14567.1 hypothetical protein EHS11_00820 [Leptospira ilyithenensis]
MKRFWFPISFLAFLVLEILLILIKTKPYYYSLSSLIGIWDGFAEINPGAVDSDFVIFRAGGYDGQFFYLVAKSLFTELDWNLIVDSYFFRLHRIGFSFIVGSFSFIIGFEYYALIAIFVLNIVFLASYYALHSLLPDGKKQYSLLYLFSPYSLNSNLLLVADGFFASLVILGVFFYLKSNKTYLDEILSVLFFTLAIFTRELGIFLLLPIVFQSILAKNRRQTSIFLLPLFGFVFFLIWTWSISPNHLGTNPLGFGDMTDFPLYGFIKSFYDNGRFHLSAKESVKLLLFAQYFLLFVYILRKIRDLFQASESLSHTKELLFILPILATLGIISIAEEGYWRSFDNLSRMFTLPLPLVIYLHTRKPNRISGIFLGSSLLLFVFLILRIALLTQGKDFYLSP